MAQGVSSLKASRKLSLALDSITTVTNPFPRYFAGSLDRTRFDVGAFNWKAVWTEGFDRVIFHWPNRFFVPARRKEAAKDLTKIAFARARFGTRFFWVVHNLRPHENAPERPDPITRLITRNFIGMLDGLIFLSESSRRAFFDVHPQARSIPSLVIVHGIYNPVEGPPVPRPTAGRPRRLLSFGQIRPYKNMEGLVRAFRATRTPDAGLTVLGYCPDPQLRARIEEAAAGDARIGLEMDDALFSDAQIEHVIDSHDAVVLPYLQILNSGVALHAISRHRPILAPAIGSLPELRSQVGEDWAHLYEGPISAEVLDDFLLNGPCADTPPPDLARFAWPTIGAQVSDFVASARKGRGV